ncbi:MAG: hypothetical protein J7J96_02820 [Sulfurimonas sp.]|nr:hypothetical protein [Sulfurimonas sp.]
MSIKNDIERVREELTSEEKFFEKSVITERFVKKYKNVIIGSVVAIVAIVAINIVYDMNNESRIVSANETLSELSKNPLNDGALSQLKVLSSDLHDLFIYSKAVVDKDVKTLETLKSSEAVLIDDLATYESLQNTKDVSQLNNYALKQDSIYKDLANVESAIMLINEGKTDEAHEKLILISDASSLDKVAKALLHYGVK